MANNVERSLEETVPVLRLAERYHIFHSNEIRTFVADRRHHEYTVMRATAERKHFLNYIAFEKRFASQLTVRVAARSVPQGIKDRLVRDARLRVNLVFSRAVKRFRGDADLWLHYVRHLLKDGSHRAASRVLARALAFCSTSVDVWRAAISFHFDKNGDANGARGLAHRALRALPDCPDIWIEYFRLELFFLARLIENRVRAGYSPEPTAEERAQGQKRRDAAAKHRGARAAAWRSRNENGGKGSASSNKKKQKKKEKRRRIETDESDEAPGQDVESKKADIRENAQSNVNGGDGEGQTEPSDDEMGGTDDLPQPDTEDEEELSEDDGEDIDTEVSGFWNGAVPLAVVKQGFEKVRFTAKHRAQLFNIAVECPWIGQKVLLDLSKLLREKFPSCHVAEFIVVRLKWEMARCNLDRVKAVVMQQLKSKRTTEKDSNASLKDLDAELRKSIVVGQRALNKESALALKLVRAYGLFVFKPMEDKNERDAVLLSFESFKTLFKQFGLSAKLLKKWNRTLSTFLLPPPQVDVEATQSGEDGERSKQDISKEKTIKDLRMFLQKRGLHSDIVVGEVTAQNFVPLLLQNCIVPFRDDKQEQVVKLYAAAETDPELLHAMVMRIMATPPVRMQTVRVLIEAELRSGQDITGGRALLEPARIREVRQVFEKGASLPDAKRDVEFWLSYVQFEREVARSAKMTNLVHAKALRVMDERLRETFMERHLLSNLSAAL